MWTDARDHAALLPRDAAAAPCTWIMVVVVGMVGRPLGCAQICSAVPSFAPFEFPTCLANGCRGTVAERSRLACLRHCRFKHVQAVAASQLPINNGAKPLVMNLLSYAKSQKRKLWVGLSAVLLNYSVPQLLHCYTDLNCSALPCFAVLCAIGMATNQGRHCSWLCSLSSVRAQLPFPFPC